MLIQLHPTFLVELHGPKLCLKEKKDLKEAAGEKGTALLSLVLTAASLKSFGGFYVHFNFKHEEVWDCRVSRFHVF